MVTESSRSAHEIAHGRALAAGETETTWGWGTPAGRRRAERRAALIVGAARLRPGMTALEIGCGTGLFTEKLAASGARIVAVDISPDLLAKAEARGLDPDQVRFFERRVEDVRLSDVLPQGWGGDPFDAIVGSSVLHHLDLAGALRSFTSLLKRDGVMAFAEPNLLNPQVFMERHFRSWFPYVSADEWAIVRWSMRRTLRRAGFTDVAITPFDWLHPSTPPALIPAVSVLGQIAERVPGVREFAGSVLISATKP